MIRECVRQEEDTRQEMGDTLKRSIPIKHVYRVTQKMYTAHYRWKFPDVKNMSLAEIITDNEMRGRNFIMDVEILGTSRGIKYIVALKITKTRDNRWVVLAAQNLDETGKTYKPSGKHLYVISTDVFARKTELADDSSSSSSSSSNREKNLS